MPTVVWRHDFPADWCFVIAIPAGGEGLSSHGEEGVFASLTPSVHISEEVCRITQLLLMPALVERDIESFGRAMTAIDRKTGAYFSDVQGGLYSHEATNETVAAMLREGAFGAGQSSWGPAVYGLVREEPGLAARVAHARAPAGERARRFRDHRPRAQHPEPRSKSAVTRYDSCASASLQPGQRRRRSATRAPPSPRRGRSR